MKANGKNMASKIDAKVRDAINRKEAMNNTLQTVKSSRQGWRHTGILQYVRYFSTEGVYSVGLGGSPVVGA